MRQARTKQKSEMGDPRLIREGRCGGRRFLGGHAVVREMWGWVVCHSNEIEKSV